MGCQALLELAGNQLGDASFSLPFQVYTSPLHTTPHLSSPHHTSPLLSSPHLTHHTTPHRSSPPHTTPHLTSPHHTTPHHTHLTSPHHTTHSSPLLTTPHLPSPLLVCIPFFPLSSSKFHHTVILGDMNYRTQNMALDDVISCISSCDSFHFLSSSSPLPSVSSFRYLICMLTYLLTVCVSTDCVRIY